MSRLSTSLLFFMGLLLAFPANVQASDPIKHFVKAQSNTLIKKIFPGRQAHKGSVNAYHEKGTYFSSGMSGKLTQYSARAVATSADVQVLSPMVNMEYITPRDGHGKGQAHITFIRSLKVLGSVERIEPGAGSLTMSGAYSAARSFGVRAARAVFPGARSRRFRSIDTGSERRPSLIPPRS